jgi:hypothetical protein
MIRVFVSSVSLGLETARQQVTADLHRAGYDVTATQRLGSHLQPQLTSACDKFVVQTSSCP